MIIDLKKSLEFKLTFIDLKYIWKTAISAREKSFEQICCSYHDNIEHHATKNYKFIIWRNKKRSNNYALTFPVVRECCWMC